MLRHREAGLPLTSQAVLFRAPSHSAVLELELTRRGIPFVKFGGLKFLEASHVKDMLAVLRFAKNRSDITQPNNSRPEAATDLDGRHGSVRTRSWRRSLQRLRRKRVLRPSANVRGS